jgi:hypothetical protein
MRVEQVYAYFNFNWSEVSRELDVAMTTIHHWRKKGYIPLPAQKMIEAATGGELVADEAEANLCPTCSRVLPAKIKKGS